MFKAPQPAGNYT